MLELFSEDNEKDSLDATRNLYTFSFTLNSNIDALKIELKETCELLKQIQAKDLEAIKLQICNSTCIDEEAQPTANQLDEQVVSFSDPVALEPMSANLTSEAAISESISENSMATSNQIDNNDSVAEELNEIFKQTNEMLVEKKLTEKIARYQRKTANATMTKKIEDANTVKKTFKINEVRIIKCADDLLKLFDVDTKKWPYKDAITLIEALGGSIKIDSGTSHQKVIFGDVPRGYMSLEENVEESEIIKVTKGISRPHAENSGVLRHNNLKLVKSVIEEALPQNWRAIIEESRKKPSTCELRL